MHLRIKNRLSLESDILIFSIAFFYILASALLSPIYPLFVKNIVGKEAYVGFVISFIGLAWLITTFIADRLIYKIGKTYLLKISLLGMHDILIKNGTIVDGVGTPAYHADVAIKDGKIVDLKTKGLMIPEKATSTPLEYSVQGNDVLLLKDIAEITGGKYNPKKEEIVVEEEEIIVARGFAGYLIPLALILFIIDIAVRKFNRQMV